MDFLGQWQKAHFGRAARVHIQSYHMMRGKRGPFGNESSKMPEGAVGKLFGKLN